MSSFTIMSWGLVEVKSELGGCQRDQCECELNTAEQDVGTCTP